MSTSELSPLSPRQRQIAPHRPLTPRELSVAALVGKGYDYDRIATTLNISPQYARNIVCVIADLLPNPDDLKPFTLVLLWAAHDKWLEEYRKGAA